MLSSPDRLRFVALNLNEPRRCVFLQTYILFSALVVCNRKKVSNEEHEQAQGFQFERVRIGDYQPVRRASQLVFLSFFACQHRAGSGYVCVWFCCHAPVPSNLLLLLATSLKPPAPSLMLPAQHQSTNFAADSPWFVEGNLVEGFQVQTGELSEGTLATIMSFRAALKWVQGSGAGLSDTVHGVDLRLVFLLREAPALE